MMFAVPWQVFVSCSNGSVGDRKPSCRTGTFGLPSTRAGCDASFCRRCLGCHWLGASRASYVPNSGDVGCHCQGSHTRSAGLVAVGSVRRRKLTEDERQTALGWFRVLPLRVDHEMSSLALSRLSELATDHHLSVYDAAYLELAQRRKLVLSCNDAALRAGGAGRLSSCKNLI